MEVPDMLRSQKSLLLCAGTSSIACVCEYLMLPMGLPVLVEDAMCLLTLKEQRHFIISTTSADTLSLFESIGLATRN